MPYTCDSGDPNPVVMIITNQAEAETSALCGECFLLWIRGAYEAIFGPAETPAKGSKRKPKAETPPAEPGDSGEAPGPVADPVTGDETDEDEARDASADYGDRLPGETRQPEQVPTA